MPATVSDCIRWATTTMPTVLSASSTSATPSLSMTRTAGMKCSAYVTK